jgi:dTDP-4-amino-4,6-dideoxygalactose transaminase
MILCANPAAQFQSHQAEIEAAVLDVLRGSRHILGPQVEALEEEFADYIGTKKAVGVANGTDALELAIRALDIGPGDEVITVSHTAVATVAAIESAGAVPVLVDVDPRYYTLDPTRLDELLTSKTRAVIAVHLYGQPVDLDAIGQFCDRNNLALIEDASQAHGARWKGRRVGSIGRVGCFSCYPTKNLGAVGDAGLVTTSDEGLARKICSLREYGWKERYISDIPGRNSRLDELQAAILRVKLRHLDESNGRRRSHAAEYSRLLGGSHVLIPEVRANAEHVFHLYVVRTKRREKLVNDFRASGIFPGIHYPVPIHCQPAYRDRIRTSASMDVTAELAEEVLSLPLYPELQLEQIAEIASVLAASRPA